VVRETFAVLVATGLALADAACLHGDDDEATPSRIPAKLSGRTVVRGAPPRERALLQRAVRGMERTTLTRIAIRPLEEGQTGEGAAVAISFTWHAGRASGGNGTSGSWRVPSAATSRRPAYRPRSA
jgi:hypothetical protein